MYKFPQNFHILENWFVTRSPSKAKKILSGIYKYILRKLAIFDIVWPKDKAIELWGDVNENGR